MDYGGSDIITKKTQNYLVCSLLVDGLLRTVNLLVALGIVFTEEEWPKGILL